jgi:prepilin-type N-terminal cleavage/methylation domain-containing protein
MALARSRFSDNARGFSLLEVLVSTALLATGLLSIAQLFAIATDSNRRARMSTCAAILAEQKMEQLRGLTWGYDLLGLPLSDMSSNISVLPATATAGSGLAPSPPHSLITNVPGFVDYLDAYGTWVGTGSNPPAGTVYIRRWSIEPLPTNPNNTLILQILVTRFLNRGTAADAGSVKRLPEEARLITVKTRKSR